MNNSYHTTHLSQSQQHVLNHAQQQQPQHQQQTQQHQQQHHISNMNANASLLPTPTTTTTIGYLQSQQQLAHAHLPTAAQPPLPPPTPQQQQPQPQSTVTHAPYNSNDLTQATVAATYSFDGRQLQQASNPATLDKSFFTDATTTPTHYFTAANATNAPATQPNTILITNNFAQQQQQQQQQRTTNGNTIATATTYNTNNTNNNNIRIVSATPQHGTTHLCSISNSISKDAQQLQVADVLQMQTLPTTTATQHLYQQSQQPQASYYQATRQPQPSNQPVIPTLLAQHFTQHHHHQQPQQQQQQSHYLSPPTTNAMQLQLTGPPQHYYLPAAVDSTGAQSTKLLSASSANALLNNAVAVNDAVAEANAVPSTPSVMGANNSSTVLLDRISICINNHYTDGASNSLGINSSTPDASNNTLSVTPPAQQQQQQQQPSPIIPAIQHKAIVDATNGLLVDPYASNESTTLVIDEPDSTTTTPNTPPTTPESGSPTSTTITTNSSNGGATQSPSTTTSGRIMKSPEQNNSKNAFAALARSLSHEMAFLIDDVDIPDHSDTNDDDGPDALDALDVSETSTIKAKVVEVIELVKSPESNAITSNSTLIDCPAKVPPRPPSPKPIAKPKSAFNNGEDVFIQRQDGRFYLGTVISSNVDGKYLVRFDDKSELWCTPEEMRKLGGGQQTNDQAQGPMCVACKSSQIEDVVEICERCGRGYHRKCTTETIVGSDVWLCKRCLKPMKMNASAEAVSSKISIGLTNPSCYCGKMDSKSPDYKLQCCKCQHWFHTHCIQCLNRKVLRGDGFFVYCCTYCNNGAEFLQRLKMNWVDLLHLTLYNLYDAKKHHKYYHLTKDILPFVLEKRKMLPITKSWMEMSENKLLDVLRGTLKEHTDRFICGREIKKGHYYYSLRNNGPPILPKYCVKTDDVLNESLLIDVCKLNLYKSSKENTASAIPILRNTINFKTTLHKNKNQLIGNKKDVYEFHTEDDDTTDDEIPIKDIMEKVRKNKTSPKYSTHLAQIDVEDENANDANAGGILHTPTKKSLNSNDPKEAAALLKRSSGAGTPTKLKITACTKEQDELLESNNNDESEAIAATPTVAVAIEKSSRKRKAFTLSKTYKEIAAEAAAKRYDSNRICDSSSDENSSSSRGTSLNVIIPPPKNFLGLNNPFRMVTPKKQDNQHGNYGGNKKSVSFGPLVKSSIFNTTTLDFSSKLAALKSAGIFPNLSTSDLAKAASQPRTVRTIKRRLSAKDITIGPNQEVRRRRTRRLSSNVEVISTTTINPIPSNFFPIHAKDLLSHNANVTINNLHNNNNSNNNNNIITTTTTIGSAITYRKLLFQQQQQQQQQSCTPPTTTTTTVVSSPSSNTSSSVASSSSPPTSCTSSLDSMPTTQQELSTNPKPNIHGRRLRQRPQKHSPSNSRRSSLSSASTSSNSSTVAAPTVATGSDAIMQDLKQSVNKYFGAANRIESGEQFSIRAKRQLPNGQMQYLIEWGGAVGVGVGVGVGMSADFNASCIAHMRNLIGNTTAA